MYPPLPVAPWMCVIEWHATQVMPAWAVGWVFMSKVGSSNAPLNSGTGSWQPAHHREPFVLPSRSRETFRVSATLTKYAGLLNELNLCDEWKWSL